MATIYENSPSGKCLILGASEALYYPFSLGDWKEIRLGCLLSVTSSTGDNTLYGANEAITMTSPHTSMFFGFAYTGTSNGQLGLPGQSGITYIGPWNWNETLQNRFGSDRIFWNASYNDNTDSVVIDLTGRKNRVTTNNNGMIYTNAFVGNNNTSFYGVIVGISGTGYNVEMIRKTGDGAYYNATVERTKEYIAAVPERTWLGSGMYTVGFNTGAPLLPKPNAVLIMLPFTLNRLRIHTVVVEKYA